MTKELFEALKQKYEALNETLCCSHEVDADYFARSFEKVKLKYTLEQQNLIPYYPKNDPQIKALLEKYLEWLKETDGCPLVIWQTKKQIETGDFLIYPITHLDPTYLKALQEKKERLMHDKSISAILIDDEIKSIVLKNKVKNNDITLSKEEVRAIYNDKAEFYSYWIRLLKAKESILERDVKYNSEPKTLKSINRELELMELKAEIQAKQNFLNMYKFRNEKIK